MRASSSRSGRSKSSAFSRSDRLGHGRLRSGLDGDAARPQEPLHGLDEGRRGAHAQGPGADVDLGAIHPEAEERAGTVPRCASQIARRAGSGSGVPPAGRRPGTPAAAGGAGDAGARPRPGAGGRRRRGASGRWPCPRPCRAPGAGAPLRRCAALCRNSSGKIVTSIVPSTSSMVAKPMRLPFFVLISRRADTSPHRRTRAPSSAWRELRRCPRRRAAGRAPRRPGAGGRRGRSRAPPSRGARRCSGSHSAIEASTGIGLEAGALVGAAQEVEHRDLALVALALVALARPRRRRRAAAMSWARGRPSESKAPALTRLSTTRRLTSWRSRRRQKSTSDLKRPSRSRAATIVSIAFWPRFLMAPSPKRIVSPSTPKREAGDVDVRRQDARCPCARHSSMWTTTLSVFAISDVRSAAMNSTG